MHMEKQHEEAYSHTHPHTQTMNDKKKDHVLWLTDSPDAVAQGAGGCIEEIGRICTVDPASRGGGGGDTEI